ncbi:Helix-turn-helix [Flavobacterium fontis]|jgi:transcriptional regulator with XRE-family HTH domain|uniref:Helix-turn-helix n=1 Tax=Flavobacterium fontis TaxID=1124188 RepID=A0A1M5A086_9FLAO|nr:MULTISPECIES: helix-turn-helix domain-containing protein [Flavobacterium]MCZ8170059.1 helix-turn-helix domain-containing protein [Flavobacterium sp.]MCZ8297079.1 helix-turn-helix domain-containing protein [Flavobacterium sp.]SHF23720.1 Helix-turn-helix [Flavobacterium fontis]
MLDQLLKQGREASGLSTRALAHQSGIDQALISKFENGNRIPTQAQARLLAELLGIALQPVLVAWYRVKLLHLIDFNPEAIEAITGILEEKGLNLAKSAEKEAQIASILSEIDLLKNRLQNL